MTLGIGCSWDIGRVAEVLLPPVNWLCTGVVNIHVVQWSSGWSFWLFVAFGVVISYADRILESISMLFKKQYSLLHLVCFELFCLLSVICTLILLKSDNGKPQYEQAVVGIGVVVALRWISWRVDR